LVNRYCVETNCTIVSVDYRLAPEHKAPSGIYDGYGALKDIIENAHKHKIDRKRLGVFGEGAGGYITAGVCMMLAEKDESNLIKFQV
jgi:acetyl esterase